jgi:hypothetical protein
MGRAERCEVHSVINCFKCFYRSPHMTNDKPKEEIEKIILERKSKGWLSFVKWTCGGCEKRCRSEEPDIVRDEYRCDCGHVTRPEGFGVMIAKAVPDNS